MRYPKNLKNGGCIGFVAPSFGCATEPYRSRFDHALERFAETGFETKKGPNCYVAEGVGISNTPKKCAEELMDFYCDDESDALISCGGGELMCETIEKVDFEQIRRAEPKWFMGYSDNTNFIFLLSTLCDTAAVYGPNAAAFGAEGELHACLEDALRILKGESHTVQGYDRWEEQSAVTESTPFEPYHLTRERILKIWDPCQSGRGCVGPRLEEDLAESGRWIENAKYFHGNLEISGRLIGGCLDCLINLVGTKYDRVKEFLGRYEKDGFLWFLEACDLNPLQVRRAIWQLKEAGWFEHCRGFLFGRPLHFGEETMGLDMYEAVLAGLREFRVPIILDGDLGHLPPAMPLVCGSMGRLRVMGNDLSITFEYV